MLHLLKFTLLKTLNSYTMNKYLLVCLICCSSFLANAQTIKKAPTKKTNTNAVVKKPLATSVDKTGRHINITLTPFKNCWIYLGSYYGTGRTITDSAYLDGNSKGVFKGNTKLTGGIYFVVSPQYTIQFELLMDAEQHFSIVADSAKKEQFQIIGSADNDLFKEYSKVTSVKGKHLYDLNNQLATAKTREDSLQIRDEIIKGNKELQAYREDIVAKNPNSLLSMLFTVMKRPEFPPIPMVNGKPDSLYPYRYVKDHYWDDVNFFDDRLLRTPFFEPKMDDYFKYQVSPEADSIIQEVKYMLLSARSGKEIFPYLLTKFTNKYVNPEYMGQDKVFLYLFNDFYSKGDTVFLNAASRKMIFDRAYSLMANQIGEPAPVLNLTDTLGKVQPMYNINAAFTLVAFWDPHCGHCKEQIPRIDSMYKSKWKALGLKVYSVYVYDDNVPDWKKFINEKELFDWTHVYQTKAARDLEIKNNQAGFRQLYDARVTPTIYLLDDKKRIIAKQLSLEQFDDVISAKLKNKNNK
jgi:thiol-disulfide isomerase/thioredoxin